MTTNGSPAFLEALDEITRIVGNAHLVVEDTAIDARSLDTSTSVQRPGGFVYPASVEEVQAIVRAANRYGIALWPVSKGKNWGYGAATPVHEGALVVVLERLNRILEVNEELAYAVIEPGVTYGQLCRYIQENHPGLWTDTTDSTPEGSVIGNALERGLGETPYGDHFGNLCGMEVVLPTGELVRTGGGPAEGGRTWATHKWGTGPYLEGLFTQSNLGIVVKAGLWLMPAPEKFASVFYEVTEDRHIDGAINGMRRMALQRIIKSNIHAGNDSVLLSIINPHYRSYPDLPVPLGESERAKLRKRYKVGLWTFNWGLYGGASEVSAWKTILKRELGPYGRLTFMTDPAIRMARKILIHLRKKGPGSMEAKLFQAVSGKPLECAEMGPYQHDLLKGIPTEYFLRYAYCQSLRPIPDNNLDPARDGCGEMWHPPVIPFTSADLRRILSICEPIYSRHEKDFCVTLLLINPRAIVTLFGIFFPRNVEPERAKAAALYNELFDATLAAGYQPYRTSVISMPKILDTNPAFKSLAATIKSALDPNGVLSPSRYGVGK